MANNINMWEDIEDLEVNGKLQQAIDLSQCYYYAFIEPNKIELEQAKQEYINKYEHIDNYV